MFVAAAAEAFVSILESSDLVLALDRLLYV